MIPPSSKSGWVARKARRVESLFELVGAALILSAFVLVQMHRMETTSLTYLLLNLAGAGTLAVVAAIDGDVGFLLLEGVWSAVSAFGTVRWLLQVGPGARPPSGAT
jgi:hypothetical protein